MSSAIRCPPEGFRAPFCVYFRPFPAHMRPETGLPVENEASGIPLIIISGGQAGCGVVERISSLEAGKGVRKTQETVSRGTAGPDDARAGPPYSGLPETRKTSL